MRLNDDDEVSHWPWLTKPMRSDEDEAEASSLNKPHKSKGDVTITTISAKILLTLRWSVVVLCSIRILEVYFECLSKSSLKIE